MQSHNDQALYSSTIGIYENQLGHTVWLPYIVNGRRSGILDYLSVIIEEKNGVTNTKDDSEEFTN